MQQPIPTQINLRPLRRQVHMPQKDSVHQALTHLDRVNQFITTLRQLLDNEVAIAAVCRDELAHLTNTLRLLYHWTLD